MTLLPSNPGHMMNVNEVDILSRKHVAFLLSERLMAYKNTDACVVAIPFGGVPVGYWIANQLNLTLQAMPCRMITLPGKVLKSLGSITIDAVFVHDDMLDIPQTYLYHQIQQLKNNIESEINFFNSVQPEFDFKDKTVIVVDDAILHSDGVMALLRSIRQQSPARILVVAPFITDEAAYAISQEADEVMYLYRDRSIQRVHNVVATFPKVTKEVVGKLLQQSVYKITT